MTLNDIQQAIRTASSGDDLIQFIKQNRASLGNFFISLSDDAIRHDKFKLKDICTKDLLQLPYFQDVKDSSEIIELLTLFAGLFEKIGFVGDMTVIISCLPRESSIRYRLEAVVSFSWIKNAQHDYTEKFESILSKLQQAQDFAEIDYTGQVIQDVIQYYSKGSAALTIYPDTLERFKSNFESEESRQRYKFLNHPRFKECLDGYIDTKISVEPIKNEIFTPSSLTHQIFTKNINQPVNRAGYLKQFTSSEIRADILKYGRADFTQPYQQLQPYDKVQLYCYFNMRKHFFTSYAVFESIYASISDVFDDRNFTFIDLGCGALTSGLAMASLYHDKEEQPLQFNYVGIDIAESMLKKAKEFKDTALFHEQAEFHFYANWELLEDEILEQIIHNDTFVIFNASYLFASSSLDEISLAKFTNQIVAKTNKSIYFVFQNPDRADRNVKYNAFKSHLNAHELVTNNIKRVHYRNNPNSSYEPSNEVVYFEILKL